MDRWVGKVCVITGASAGMGAHATKVLAEKGLIVVGLARRVENIEKLAKSSKGKIYAVKCDLAKEEDILNAFKWIEKTLGGVDVLINNAGVGSRASLITGDTKDYQNVLDVNVVGLCVCTREALRTMRTRGDNGQIIHINSVLGHRSPPDPTGTYGTYAPSKYAVTALTEGLRLELQGLNSKIKISGISPGVTETEFFDGLNVNISEATRNAMLNSQDIVDAIIYVLSSRPGAQIHDVMIQPLDIGNIKIINKK